MTGANLTDVDFSYALLTNAKLDNTAINGAKFYNIQAELIHFVCARGWGNTSARRKPNDDACPNAPTSADPSAAVDFTIAGLKNADFTAATLNGAKLVGASLTGSTFDNANLTSAYLQADTVQRIGPASVQFGTFPSVDFTSAQLSGVDFSGANLTGAIFDLATLDGTIFANARMAGASFQGKMKLQAVNFSFAILKSAKFNDATIAPGNSGYGANFFCAQLGGADFTDAKISTTNFANAVMPGADDGCCKQKTGAPWCGIVDQTTQTYGPVTPPNLTEKVTCPNGDIAICTPSQWRLPNWQTSGCTNPPQPQLMWAPRNCAGHTGENVTFADKNLKSCILATLPQIPVPPTEVPLATAQQITQVNCAARGIKDVTGLENFLALTKLDLSYNELPIFTLSFTFHDKLQPSHLQTLSLDGNMLTTLDVSDHPVSHCLESFQQTSWRRSGSTPTLIYIFWMHLTTN